MLAPSRTEIAPPFLGWLERMDAEAKIFLSVVTIHEIEKGIALVEQKGAKAKAAALRAWLAGLIEAYADKIFPLGANAAALAGQLEAKAISSGHNPGMADAIVAGIAKANDLVVVTTNTKHFAPFEINFTSPTTAAGTSIKDSATTP